MLALNICSPHTQPCVWSHQHGAAGWVDGDAVSLLLGGGHERRSLPGERGSAQSLETHRGQHETPEERNPLTDKHTPTHTLFISTPNAASGWITFQSILCLQLLFCGFFYILLQITRHYYNYYWAYNTTRSILRLVALICCYFPILLKGIVSDT